MRYLIVIEKAARNYSAHVPDVPGCVATGKTVAETVRAMRQSLQFHLEGLAEDAAPIPDPIRISQYVDAAIPTATTARRQTKKAS